MSKAKFNFRFEAVLKAFQHEKQIAELELVQCRDRLLEVERILTEIEAEFTELAGDWSESVVRHPAIGVPARASFQLKEDQKRQTMAALQTHLAACQRAEKVLQEKLLKLKSIEQIALGDRAEHDFEVKKKEANELREQTLKKWNSQLPKRS